MIKKTKKCDWRLLINKKQEFLQQDLKYDQKSEPKNMHEQIFA